MAENERTQARPSRLWRIILVVSLALNLAVVGVVIGVALSGRAGDGPPRSFELGIGPMARALAPQERRAIRRTLRQDRSLRGMDFRGGVDDMVATLRAEPFDPDALRRVMEAQAASVAGIQAKAQDATVQQIIAMSPERRRAFADQVAAELSKVRRTGPRPSGG